MSTVIKTNLLAPSPQGPQSEEGPIQGRQAQRGTFRSLRMEREDGGQSCLQVGAPYGLLHHPAAPPSDTGLFQPWTAGTTALVD